MLAARGGGGPRLVAWLLIGGGRVLIALIVGTDEAKVERELKRGLLACPRCAGALRPWGFARWRVLRQGAALRRLRPRRSICRPCRTTHVLLPCSMLLRRRDAVEVIGEALAAKAAGVGHRPPALSLCLPRETVRGWLRRFAARAEPLRAAFTELAYALDPSLPPIQPRASPFADACEAIAVAAQAAAGRFGELPLWQFAAAASSGRLLCNTS